VRIWLNSGLRHQPQKLQPHTVGRTSRARIVPFAETRSTPVLGSSPQARPTCSAVEPAGRANRECAAAVPPNPADGKETFSRSAIAYTFSVNLDANLTPALARPSPASMPLTPSRAAASSGLPRRVNRRCAPPRQCRSSASRTAIWTMLEFSLLGAEGARCKSDPQTVGTGKRDSGRLPAVCTLARSAALGLVRSRAWRAASSRS
jgi:hypothetical protein